MNGDELLGLDIGEKHIGVARGNLNARLAEPLTTIAAEGYEEVFKQIIDEYKSAGLVIGLPRSLEGNDTAQTKIVRAWAAAAKAKFNLEFYWQDEALTSAQAESLKSKFNRPFDDHALAATIILQDFLDGPPERRQLV